MFTDSICSFLKNKKLLKIKGFFFFFFKNRQTLFCFQTEKVRPYKIHDTYDLFIQTMSPGWEKKTSKAKEV